MVQLSYECGFRHFWAEKESSILAWKNVLMHQLRIMLQFTFLCCCFDLKKRNFFPLFPSLLKLPKKPSGNDVNMSVVTWDESTNVFVLFEAKLNFFTLILTLLPR